MRYHIISKNIGRVVEIKCPICGGKEFEVLSSTAGTQTCELPEYRCLDCSHVLLFLKPLPQVHRRVSLR